MMSLFLFGRISPRRQSEGSREPVTRITLIITESNLKSPPESGIHITVE